MDYHVALSFAGEDRPYVEEVATHLARNGVGVFYDNRERVNLWGKDLYQELSSIYRNRAHFTVVFISQHYARKLWTQHELKSAQARAFEESREYILPARFDDTEIPGILKTTGYVDLQTMSPQELAEEIMAKLRESGISLDVPISKAKGSSSESQDHRNAGTRATKAFVENGNVHVQLSGGALHQLTFSQLDESPFLLNDGADVVFIRKEEAMGHRAAKFFRRLIILVHAEDLKERVVASQKPKKDGLEGTLNIVRIDYPYLSPDGQHLFFITEGWATASAFVKVNVETGAWMLVDSAERFEPLTQNAYAGHFLVAYSGIRASGRQAYYKVIDADGHQVKEFADKASAQKFFDMIHSGPPRRLFERDTLEYSNDGVELQAMGLIFNSKRKRVVLESQSPIHVSIDRIELQVNQAQWGHRLASAGLIFTCQYFDASGKNIGSEKRPMSFGLFFDPTFRYPIFEVKGRWWFASQYNPYYPKEAHRRWRMTIELNEFDLEDSESMQLSLHSSTNLIV